MAKVVIGMDLSGNRWKSVAISAIGKDRYRILWSRAMPELPFDPHKIFEPADDDPVFNEKVLQWAETIEQTMGESLREAGSVVLGLPLERVSLRVIEVPFSQAAKIERVLPFEAEGQLPFDTDELIFDHVPLLQSDAGTKVLAASIKREVLASLLARLKLAGIDPETLTASPLSMNNLSVLAGEMDDSSRVCYLNVEANSSQLSAVEAGRTIFAMTMKTGALESVAPSAGDGGEEAAPEQSTLSASELSTRLAPRVRRALHYLEGYAPFDGGCPPPLRKMVLTGEGAAEGLDRLLSQELDVRVERFALSTEALSEDSAREGGPELAAAMALAMQKAGSAVRRSFNFRKLEFAFRPERKALVRKMIFPAVLVALILATVVARWMVIGSSEADRVKQIEGQTRTMFSKTFPDLPVVDPVKQVNAVLDESKQKKPLYQELALPSVLQILAAMSEAIPDSLNVRITNFEFSSKAKGDKEVTITGTTDTEKLDVPNEITKRLSQVPIFEKAELGNTSRQSDTEFRFTISVTLKKEME